MFRLLAFSLKDFLSHRLTEIDCTDLQSVLILGKSAGSFNFSNGVGKSNISFGIRYALTGDLPPDCNMEHIVREGCLQSEVSVKFELDGSVYTILRTRNNKTNKSEVKLSILEGFSWKDISGKTNPETDGIYKSLTKIDSKLFDNGIFLPQKSFSRLITETPSKRKELFKELLQISVYSRFEKIAAKKQSAIAKELETLRIRIEHMDVPPGAIAELNSIIGMNENSLKTINENIISTETSIKTHEESILLLKKEMASLDDKRKTKFLIEDEIKRITSSLLEMMTKLVQQEEKVTTLLAEKKRLNDESDAAGVSLETTKASLIPSSTVEEIEKQKISQANGNALIAKTKLQIADLKRPITDKEICDDCFQTVPIEHKESTSAKRAEDLLAKEGELATYFTKMSKVTAKLAAMEESIRHHRTTTDKITQIETKLTILTDKIRHIDESLAVSKDSVNDYVAKIAALKLAIPENPSIIIGDEELQVKITGLSHKIKSDGNVLDGFKQQQQSLTHQLGGLQQKLTGLMDSEKTIVSLKEKSIVLAKENRIRLQEVEAWNQRGIPTMIINNVLDDLQIEANAILARIRPEMELSFQTAIIKDDKVDDTLKITYRIRGKDRISGQLSGGQKISASLALMLGYKQLAKNNLGIDIRLLILDEVDADLDVAAIDEYAAIIRNLQQDMLIFVITHNERLKQKFSAAIVVEDDGGGSVGTLEAI
jgi:DNA repair exonuclease SbcCD ATPase subunit